ncbi:MAG: epimerase [Acholeplasma sp.]|jgi:dTDP-4-dehydrorhamnose reductase|nr:MAG: epimerase [Acholeplasma sp.]
MKKAIFTGMHGTVAPVVAKTFISNGVQVITYDRELVPVDQPLVIEAFLKTQQPDIFLHFAMGSPEWAKTLALLCLRLDIVFVYISTVSVYDGSIQGPYKIDTPADAKDNYGSYKRQSEILVHEANPKSYILRLSWQIGDAPGSNQMIDFLKKEMDQKGVVTASSKWYPSATFTVDTAEAIYHILSKLSPDLYLINSNDQFSFFDIVTYLQTIHPWIKVLETQDFIADMRMVDSRILVRKLSSYIHL